MLEIKCILQNYIKQAFLTLLISSLPFAIQAKEDKDNLGRLIKMDFEQLLTVKVFSGAKKLQALSKSASAIFVISDKDIRHSGKTTIPELLRMVPGMEVATFNAHTWAVSMRGFNSIFANKLLVLLDGRNVYSWEFSGTRWFTVDTMLEDIDRIEVIRGPGGTLWGSNAVNGVINIITKPSAETQGWLAVAGAGSKEEGFMHLRHGGEFGEQGQNHYRIYAKRHDREKYNAALDDSWRQESAGLRVDGETSDHHRWQLNAGATRSELQEGVWNTRQAQKNETNAHHVLARLESQKNAKQPWHLQTYYQAIDLDLPLPSHTEAFDIEWQHRFSPRQAHDIVWGLNARYLYSKVENTNGFFFEETENTNYLLSSFIQDEIILVPDYWTLTLGTKFEYYENNGAELLPNIRLLWTPNDKNSVWASISRAVRPTTRLEQEMRFELPIGQNRYLAFVPNPDLQSELLTAYEIGWRQRTSSQFSWENTIFVYAYDELATRRTRISQQNGITYIERVPFNQISDTISGTELLLTWQPHQDYFTQLAYSFLQVNVEPLSASDPQHQVSLRTSWQVNPKWHINLSARYVDKVCDFDGAVIISPDECITAYSSVDARIAWQLSKSLELSLSGTNLFDSHHLEFDSDGSDFLVSENPRQFYLQMRWETD